MIQTEAKPRAFRKRMIYDEDGDGVEDNREDTAEELDKFYLPMVFFPSEEIHNTHHGDMPGHINRYFDEVTEAEPSNTYDLVTAPW
jgi:hypothetical protein